MVKTRVKYSEREDSEMICSCDRNLTYRLAIMPSVDYVSPVKGILPHSLTPSLTPTLPYSLTPSLPHSLTPSLSCSYYFSHEFLILNKRIVIKYMEF
jgi:hypothetical protein